MKLLLAKDADVNAVGVHYGSVLQAAFDGYVKVFGLLVL
jgi:hypothetical protein